MHNKIKYLDDRDITLLYYSWEAIAPDLYEISLYFYNEIYDNDLKKIPTSKVDINKFSLKALNTFGYLISNLENLHEVKKNLHPMIASLSDYGKLKPFRPVEIKKGFINAIKKKFGAAWKRDCGMAWLKLATYVEKEIMIEEKKGGIMSFPNWN